MRIEQENLSNIVIRKLRIEDYDDLIALWENAGLPCKPKGRDQREHIKRELKGSNAFFLVAEKDGSLIGSIFGSHDGRKGWINRVAVAPAFRRHGIAAKLVKEVENRLYAMGIEIIACLIEDWNILSIQVFERLGYKRHPDIIYFSKREHHDV